MNCKKWHDLIMCKLDGEISEKEKQTLSLHLDSCPECRRLHRDLEQIFSGLEEPERFNLNIDPRLERTIMNEVYRLKSQSDANGVGKIVFIGLGLALMGFLINSCLSLVNSGFFDILLKIQSGLTKIAGTITIVDIVYHIVQPLVSRELNIATQWVLAVYKGTILVSIILLTQFIYNQRNSEENLKTT